MTFVQLYLVGLGVIWGCVTLLWLISLLKKDSSIIDVFWGSGFVIVGWVYFSLTVGSPSRKWLIMILVTIWGLRLTLHLALRNLPQGEDYRYQKWRVAAGQAWWWRSYVKVFLLQGSVMWLVSPCRFWLPNLLHNRDTLILLDWIAVLVWLVGFYF